MEIMIIRKWARISVLETKKKGYLKMLIWTAVTMIGFYFLDLYIGFYDGITMVLKIIPYLIVINSVFILEQEFLNRTYNVIFTGIFSRTEIILSKLFNIILNTIFMYGVYISISIIHYTVKGYSLSQFISIKDLFYNLYIFILFAFNIGAFILMLSVITKKGVLTGFITYGIYFDLMMALLAQTLASKKHYLVKEIIGALPFYVANLGFMKLSYNIHDSLVMILSGMVFLLITIAFIKNQDM